MLILIIFNQMPSHMEAYSNGNRICQLIIQSPTDIRISVMHSG